MARPAKAIETQSRNNSKAEIEMRKNVEQKLKSGIDKIIPPKYLSKKQVKIFKYIVKELKASDILGNLDIYVLTTCCIAIDRLEQIETEINNDFSLLSNSSFMASKDKYTNELSLSPQARSKIGSLTLKSEKERQDPLIQILNGSKRD